MGSGCFTTKDFVCYSTSLGRDVDSTGRYTRSYSNQEVFKADKLSSALNPFEVTRECCDSDEHPNTVPVILALDVTGSMGQAAVAVATKLNEIMTKLYKEVKDVEFMIMGIGDFSYDNTPLQVSQFESDIRIAEQIDKLYFEFGGGGNKYESYTAAWYFASRHTKLDCWNRGKKGIIITIGDEMLNPYIPEVGRCTSLEAVTGDKLQADIETKDLYTEVSNKYNVYHLDVKHGYRYLNDKDIEESFKKYLGDNFKRVNMDTIADEIINIIINEANSNTYVNSNNVSQSNEITW